MQNNQSKLFPTMTDDADKSGGTVLFTVDTEALALQTAKMNKLVESIASNLESTTQDLHEEEQSWSKTARLSIVAQGMNNKSRSLDVEGDLNTKNNNGSTSDMEKIVQKINEREEKALDTSGIGTIQDTDSKVEGHNNSTRNNNHETEGELSAADLASSISSFSSSEVLPPSAAASLADDASSMGSEKSISLLQVHLVSDCVGEEGGVNDHQNEVLLMQQEGILRVDDSSDKQTFICDWELYREWRQRQSQQMVGGSASNADNHHNSSLQRWADSSLQDSKLKLPTRRNSDSNSVGSCSQNSVQSVAGEDGNANDSFTYFDWKAWKRRKEGQRSSTSRTGSFSMSVSDGDDDFDVTSVLAKLDEWDTMEEGCQSGSDDDDDDVNSSSSSEDDGDEVESTTTEDSESNSDSSESSDGSYSVDGVHEVYEESSARSSLNRANSEKFGNGRRASMPSLRSHSDKGLRYNDTSKEELNGGWRQWQSTQRKRRMSESWSSISINLAAIEPGKAGKRCGSDSSLQSQNEADANLDTTTETSNIVEEGTLFEQDSNKADSDSNDNNNGNDSSPAAPLVASPDRLDTKDLRPGIKIRSDSLRMRSPAHQSPHARKPRRVMQRSTSLHLHVKSPHQQSPMKQNMGAWRSWQREKRRSGMLKTASGRDMWNLPFSGDSDSETTASKKHLLKSKSERWSQKDDSSSPTNPRQKLQRAQSEKLRTSSSAEEASFDWNSYRKEKRKKRTLKRSKSDLCTFGKAIDLAAEGVHCDTKEEEVIAPSGTREMRRAFSEKWDKTETMKADSNAKQRPSVEAFDWKSWRKDRRSDIKAV